MNTGATKLRRRTAGAGILAVCLAVLGFARGQDGDLAQRLEAIETQRSLERRLRAAEEAGDLQEAVRLAGAIGQLSQPVLPPYGAGDVREALARRARQLLQRHLKLIKEQRVSLRAQAAGKPCRRCSARAYTRCPLCDGRGWREARVGRRKRRLDCPPWRACPSCEETGRLAPNPSVHASMRRLVEAAQKAAMYKDPIAAVRHVLTAAKGLPGGLELEPASLDPFRPLLGAAPPDGDKVKNKGRLKSLWQSALPEKRRGFLHAYALEAATFAEGIAFLQGTEPVASVTHVRKQARRMSVEDLSWEGAALAGKFVTVTAVGKRSGADPGSADSFPLDGRIPLEGVDPSLLLTYCYLPEDLQRVRMASKLGLAPNADRSIRRYPPRGVFKALKKIGFGVPIELTGRVLTHPDGLPAVLLEVWDVQKPEAGNEGR